jgi:hypothetical protein
MRSARAHHSARIVETPSFVNSWRGPLSKEGTLTAYKTGLRAALITIVRV